jgi:hypothetical protein
MLLDKNILSVGYLWGIKKLSNGRWRPAWLSHDMSVEGEWETHELALAECNRRNNRGKNK